jgi:hypothetical protein
MLRFLKTPLAPLVAIGALILASCSGAPAFATGVGATGLNLQACLSGDITNTSAISPGVSANQHLNLCQALQLTGGTSAGQVDTTYLVSEQISASSSVTLNLTSLTDGFGNAISFGHVKAMFLWASSGNTNDCVIGAATNPFLGPWAGTTPTQAVSPGEQAVWTKGQASGIGWVVTPSTGMNLKLANSSSGTSVTCNLVILGTST